MTASPRRLEVGPARRYRCVMLAGSGLDGGPVWDEPTVARAAVLRWRLGMAAASGPSRWRNGGGGECRVQALPASLWPLPSLTADTPRTAPPAGARAQRPDSPPEPGGRCRDPGPGPAQQRATALRLAGLSLARPDRSPVPDGRVGSRALLPTGLKALARRRRPAAPPSESSSSPLEESIPLRPPPPAGPARVGQAPPGACAGPARRPDCPLALPPRKGGPVGAGPDRSESVASPTSRYRRPAGPGGGAAQRSGP